MVKLYRCYDNRLRPTERRPDLYEKEEPDLFGTCDTILQIKDTNRNNLPLHPFGERIPENVLAINWLWTFRGQLKIIATPFVDGKHYATRPEHYIPIIEHLEALHRKNFVHGDIRAYNMVLNYTNPDQLIGKLIDFDYGGKLATAENSNGSNPKYPSGYKYNLEDGLRQGRSGADITVEDDWRALGYVILGLYDLLTPESIPDGESEIGLRLQRNLLTCMRDAFLKWGNERFDNQMRKAFAAVGEQCTIFPMTNPGRFLRAYLELAQKNMFELDPTEKFKLNLEQCNMIESHNARFVGGSKEAATGSPTTQAIM